MQKVQWLEVVFHLFQQLDMATTESHHISKILIHISHAREGREVLWFLLLCRACGNVPSIRSQEMERYRCFKGDTLEDLSCSLAGRIQKCLLFSSIQRRNVKNVDISVDSNCYFWPFKWYFAKPNAVSGCHVCVDFGMSVLMILKVTKQSIAMEVSINGAQ